MASGRPRLPFTPAIRHAFIDSSGSSYHPTVVQPQQHLQQPIGYHQHSYQIQPTQDHNFNVLENLSDKERQIITDVLNRDESIRQRDAARLMLLQIELRRLSLRRKRNSIIQTIIINGGSLDRPQIDLNRIGSNTQCARCGIELGRIVNRGAPCSYCKFKVCKACRKFLQTTAITCNNGVRNICRSSIRLIDDWVCVVCYKKKIEMQSSAAAKGDWVDNYPGERQRRASITREYSPIDDPKKSIKRSWTISTPDKDSTQPSRNGSYQTHLTAQEQGSYPSLIRSQPVPMQKTYNSEEIVYDSPTSPRRILRQSTLPNPEVTYYPSNQNLLLPVSPKQQRSPQYSPYHTDNENDDDIQPSPTRYSGIRRQSTLPEPPTLLNVQQKYYGVTSPSRAYCRSPERPAPFVRQQTFPALLAGGGAPVDNTLLHIPRQLPTSPSRMLSGYPKSPDSGNESDGYSKPVRMQRQATLPNPDHTLKVLPTSPPRQLSPSYRKVSPEFVRQNTVPVEPSPIISVNSLTVHQPHTKFLPISPRAKQTFMFPQPIPAPRPFLSQQHFPAMVDEPPIDTNDLQRQHTKMAQQKRSFSNEESTANRQPPAPPGTTEGRRMLPEIPPNRSPKLVRQAHVKEELIRTSSSTEKRSPIYKTFADAKQSNPILDDYSSNSSIPLGPNTIATQALISSGNNTYYMDNLNYTDGPKASVSSDNNYLIKSEYDEQAAPLLINQNYNDGGNNYTEYTDFYQQAVSNRGLGGRRKSRELPEPPFYQSIKVALQPLSRPVEEFIEKKKPETMRSISEDTGAAAKAAATAVKPTTRRSMSHPEKDVQGQKTEQAESCALTAPAAPVKMTFAEILAAKKRQQPPRKKNTSNLDSSLSPIKPHNQILEKQDSSKSFDAVIKKVIMNERLNKIDSQDENKSQSMDERMFVDNNIRKASGVINENDADAMFKKISAVSEKTLDKKNNDKANTDEAVKIPSTLGEAEIQSAVEAAAVLFKKVVLQKRKATAKKLADEGDRKFECWANNDDYKLVFISSDSSSREEYDDGSSVDECDWDYFEPGVKRRDSPPLLLPRRGASESPQHPSDSDDERFSDSYLYRRRKCHRRPSTCSCGGGPTYVPIPVPVPIIVPVSGEMSRTLQEQFHQYTISSWRQKQHTASLIRQPHGQCSGEASTLAATMERATTIKEQQQPFRNSNDVYMNEHCMESLNDANSSTGLTVEQSALIAKMSDIVHDSASDKTSDDIKYLYNDKKNSEAEANQVPSSCNLTEQKNMISIGKIKTEDPEGYLASENIFSSDSASDTESETSIQRSYDVYGAAQDEEIASESSSDVDYSEVDTDSDDTGTIADRKRFTRVFVVNRNTSSGSSNSGSVNISTCSSDTDSSDNDTDVDGSDCVVLNYIKNIDDLDDTLGRKDAIVLNYMKTFDEEHQDSSESLQQFLKLEKESILDSDSSSHSSSIGTLSEEKIPEILIFEPSEYAKDSNKDFNSMIAVEVDSLPTISTIEGFSSFLEVKETHEIDLSEADTIENSESYLDNTISLLDLNTIAKQVNNNESEEVDLHAHSMVGNTDAENATDEELESEEGEEEADGEDTADISDDSLIVNSNKNNVNEAENTNTTNDQTCFATPIHTKCTVDHSGVPGGAATVSGNDAFTCESCTDTETTVEYTAYGNSVLDEIEPSSSKDVCCLFTNNKNIVINNKYTSLVMITQGSVNPQVSIVTTDTTHLITTNDQPVTVRHTNWEPKQITHASEYTNEIELNDEINDHNNKSEDEMQESNNDNASAILDSDGKISKRSAMCTKNNNKATEDCINNSESVTVVTGGNTLSAVVCLEDGLADDDSWVEEVSQDEEEFAATTDSDSCEEFMVDREEELRGYNRTSIDFTLHTIVEESCEESEVETPKRMSASELEKYFFFGLGDPGQNTLSKHESVSETSSVCSEGLESLPVEEQTPNVDLASSRLEKYFLSGFMGFEASDESGSVGSDSEGEPSPERRKRLVRARGTGRSQSNSLDNLLATKDSEEPQLEVQSPEPIDEPQEAARKSQSRDSGFIGSNDDLLKEDLKSPELKLELPEIKEETKAEIPEPLSRKDSFNNWSSDEETNLMMSKMRQFFKTLVAASANAQIANRNTPIIDGLKKKTKPPQLVYFENELTRLMKTVPGIRDDQVREIVEYLSSEDTWSDSYESSDYTSSDVESRNELQEQISASCQQIISKFDCAEDEEGDMGDGGLLVDEPGINKETAFVYQKLVASLSKISAGEEKPITDSPPLIAKVITHIGTRLVALMHEVSSGESLASSSPRSSRYHRKLQQKISATTTEDEDEVSDHDFNLPRSKSHDLLLSEKPRSSTSDMGEEKESDYERFSWRGSFESALLAPNDSRTKLTNIENIPSPASVLAAKRRSAGDLLFNAKSLSREQLDRVRSCGSIGGDEADKLWPNKEQRRKSANCDTDDSSDEIDRLVSRSTLPRSLQNAMPASTNSLPRLSSSTISTLPNSNSTMQKSQSVHQILQNNVKSARYRPPGFNRTQPQVTQPKRAMSAPGLQPIYLRRDRRKIQIVEEANAAEVHNASIAGLKNATVPISKSASPAASPGSATSDPYPSQSDEDIDRLVALHQHRQNSLSSLGVRSDSMASVYSGAGEGRYGTVTVRGQVEFGMQYNYKHSALEILVKQCRDLAAVDTKRNRSDPYVKLYLLPDKSKTGKRKTKVKKHTLNPVFDETLRFYMSLNSLESRTLWLTVWHSDMFGRNDFLGEVLMPLQGKVFDNPQPQWYNLQERTEPFDDLPVYKGDIIVGLKFIPPDSGASTPHSTPKSGGSLNLRKFSVKSGSSSGSRNSKGALHVLVKEAKHLSAVKANGTCDAFCKSYLLPDKNRSSKQKTAVVKRSINPVWNHTFIYDDVSLQDLSERALELTTWDHDRLASNEFLGGVRFSLGTGKANGKPADWMDATGKELSLWQSMLNRPNFWVEGCLTLRSSLDNARVAT